MRRLVLLSAAAAFFAVAAAPATAHIQVRPAAVAPGDPVLFEVLVPGERDAHTVKVSLQIPADVLPFSWESTPGWERTETTKADGSLDVVTWTGELEEDGFARFAFLASTPEEEGEIVWKALQFYDDDHESAWIGAPDSENPAPVTVVSKSAPKQNAGGEGAEASTEAVPAASATPGAPAVEASPAAAVVPAGDGDESPLALILGASGFVLGAAALIVAVAGRRAKSPAKM